MVIWFLFGAMCAVVILLILAYFKLASLHRQAHEMWQQLNRQLKYRLDLIPGLALSAASMAELDREFIYHLSALKEPTGTALQPRVTYEAQLTKAFQKIFEAAKQHPELKTDEHFAKLQASIQESERQIQRAKRKYNSAAHNFNMMAGVIPLNWMTKILEMPSYEYFDFDSSI